METAQNVTDTSIIDEGSVVDSSNESSPDTSKSKERLFTQAEVDTIVTERLNQERTKFEEIKREAEDRYRKISKTHEALDTSARNLAEAFLSAVSPEIAALLKKLPLPDQLDWFAEHGAKPVPRLQAPIINDIGGKNAKTLPEAEEDRLKELRARFRIGRSH